LQTAFRTRPPRLSGLSGRRPGNPGTRVAADQTDPGRRAGPDRL